VANEFNSHHYKNSISLKGQLIELKMQYDNETIAKQNYQKLYALIQMVYNPNNAILFSKESALSNISVIIDELKLPENYRRCIGLRLDKFENKFFITVELIYYTLNDKAC
jgi:hypothetical protein